MSYANRPPIPTTDTKFTPVMFESADYLCGCTLTDGSGFLTWTNGGSVKFAKHASPSDWVVNGSVTAADGSFTPAGLVSQSCWTGPDGFPYVLVIRRASSTIYFEVYKANSATAPSSFSLHGTVTTSGMSGGFVNADIPLCGIPYMDGNTWVLGGPSWRITLSQVWVQASVYRSTDGGATWSQRFQKGYHSGSRYLDYMSAHIGYDPATGHLWWMSGTTSAGNVSSAGDWWRSTDGGATWAVHQNVGVDFSSPYTGHKGFMYGLPSGAGSTFRYNAPAVSYTDRTTTASHVSVSDQYLRVCNGAGTLYLFHANTVQWALPAGDRKPVVGHVGFG